MSEIKSDWLTCTLLVVKSLVVVEIVIFPFRSNHHQADHRSPITGFDPSSSLPLAYGNIYSARVWTARTSFTFIPLLDHYRRRWAVRGPVNQISVVRLLSTLVSKGHWHTGQTSRGHGEEASRPGRAIFTGQGVSIIPRDVRCCCCKRNKTHAGLVLPLSVRLCPLAAAAVS